MCIDFLGKVYSVGDGFCYNGIIHNKNSQDSYHFVIDCGNKTPRCKNTWKAKLNNADCKMRLEEITDEIAYENNHINLFVLTHFHEDHYSGYKQLFKKTTIDIIVMPYLYPEERLCLVINSDLDDDDLLINPYSTMLNMAKEKNSGAKLVLVRGNSNDNMYEDDMPWGIAMKKLNTYWMWKI